MAKSHNVKKHGVSTKSTSSSKINSSSGNWIVRNSCSGRIIDKSAVADNLITRYDKTFRELRNK